METVGWAYSLAERLLAEALPSRWAHTLGVASRAREVAQLVPGRAEVLEAAAVLHDIGYSPLAVATGFHPLDGAVYLRDHVQVDDLLVRLVAHHSFAVVEAEERGLRSELEAAFPPIDDQALTDALVFCDMTTTPFGERTSVEERLSEIVSRYGSGSLVTRFIRRAEPEIIASVERVRASAAEAGMVL